MKPEDWITYQLGDLFTFKNGLNFNQSDKGEAIKIVGVADFKSRTKLTETASLATVTVANTVRESELLKDGDLLFVRSNGNKALIGRCLYFPKVLERLAFSGFTIRGRVNKEKLSSDFASHLMRSKHVADQLHENGEGTNINNLSQEVLNNVLVQIPGISEQQRITKVLNTWDEAIATVEKLLASSRQQKRALMHQLLTGARRLRKRAEKYSRCHASEIFSPSSIRANGALDLLSVMQDQGVVPRHLLSRKVAMPEGSTEAYKLVEKGDFVISLRSFEGGLEYSNYRGLVSPAYTVIRPQRKICDDFYRHYFKSVDFISRLAIAVIGIRDGKQISYDDFAFLKLPNPKLDEQKAIANILNAAEADMNKHALLLQKLHEEKRALMQDLLTGKRRLRLLANEEAVNT